MIPTRLLFEIELDYQSKLFAPLSRIGSHRYDASKKKYVWVFPLGKVTNVTAILGKPLKMRKEELEAIQPYLPLVGKKVVVNKAYGEGFIEVQTSPDKPGFFIVTTVRDKKPQNTLVSFGAVQALWKAIRKQQKGKIVKTHTIADNYCQGLGIVDFNVYTNGMFNWKYFSGSRKHYLIFYAAIKVLCHYGVVEHVAKASKSGVRRLKESWEIQKGLEGL